MTKNNRTNTAKGNEMQVTLSQQDIETIIEVLEDKSQYARDYALIERLERQLEEAEIEAQAERER